VSRAASGGVIARSRSSRAVLLLTLTIIAAIAFVVYRWRTSGFEWSLFASTFKGVHWGWLIASVVVILGTYMGRALRWRVMVQPLRTDSSLWRIFDATVIGFTAIVFFGRAGELVRPYLISSREKVPFSSQMAAWLLERVLDLLMVLLIFGIALSEIPHSGLKPGPHLRTVLEVGGLTITVLGVGCLLLLAGFRYFSGALHDRLMSAVAFLPAATREKIDRMLGAFREGFGSTRSTGFVLQLVGYSILEWVLISACFLCVFRAFPVTARFSVADVVIFMGFVSIGSAIQIPGVGGGMQVAAVVVLTELFGLTLETASGFAIALWLITFVTIVPFGMALAFREGLNWRNLSHVREEVEP
jgi:glycosyltransferase 2 family protein